MSEIEIRSKDVRMVPIDEILLNKRNFNQHSDDQIDRLVKLIEYQGFRDPITISNRSGVCIAGEGRYLAAKKLGMTELPAIFQDFESEDQETAYGISHNAIHSWSELNLSAINTDIGTWDPSFDLDLLGIKDFVLEPAEMIPQCDEDEVPEHVEPRTKLGDIYQLGRHRLMCGDSTSIDAVEKLMDGEKADLWLTDPPYGVSYRTNKHDKIENDDLPIEEMAEFWAAVACNALIVCSDKSSYYWFACQGGDQMMMMMSISRAGWKVRHELIWVKDSLVLGRCDYHYKHEPILYGWKQDGTHEWNSDRKQTSVLEFARPKRSEEHPTMKPVALVEYLMGNNTKSNQIVLDTFGGSGTTLVAAEKSNRQARLIEISPKYCDVIVSRWEKFTGKKAELLNPDRKEVVTDGEART